MNSALAVSLFTIATWLSAAPVASANLLTFEASDRQINEVPIYSTTNMKVSDKSIKLNHVGSGLRIKKIVFLKIKVYVASIFVSNLPSVKRTESEALNSIAAQPASAIKLQFTYDVDQKKIREALEESLQANGFDPADPQINRLMELIQAGGDFKKGSTLMLGFTKDTDGYETIYIQDASGKVSVLPNGKGLIKKVYSMWLGEPPDDGLANLKKDLISGK